jgi:hypothetical protein
MKYGEEGRSGQFLLCCSISFAQSPLSLLFAFIVSVSDLMVSKVSPSVSKLVPSQGNPLAALMYGISLLYLFEEINYPLPLTI